MKRSRAEYIIVTLNRFPLVIVLLSLLITFIAVQTSSKEIVIVALGMCGLLVIGSAKFKVMILVSAGVILGLFQYNRFTVLPANHLSNYLGKSLTIQGEVVSSPVSSGAMQKIILRPLSYFEDNSRQSFGGGKVIFSVNKYLFDIHKADILELKLGLKAPEKIEEFDYAGYLLTEDIYAVGENPASIKVVSRNINVLDSFRERVITTVRSTFPEPHAALLLGILIGTKEDIPQQFSQDLKATGTSHVIAVSGFNVTVLAGVFLSISGILPRRIVAVLAIIMLFLFLILVGVGNIPALRAVLTGSAAIIGSLSGRRGAAYNLLALSCLIVLLINPFSYKSISFQLSFGAVLGLMLIQPKLEMLRLRFFNENLYSELSTSVSANLATFPIIFSNFGTLTLWSPVVNVIIAPLVPMIMFMGAIYAGISFVSSTLAGLIAVPVWFLLDLLIRLIGFGANLPLAVLSFSQRRVEVSLLILLLICIYIFEINFLQTKLSDG